MKHLSSSVSGARRRSRNGIERAPGAPIVVRRSPLGRSLGVLRLGPLALRCALGRSGTSPLKREGDGATPLGNWALLGGYRRRDRMAVPPSPLALRDTRPSDGWCDAPADASYNRPVALPHPASAEAMVRSDRLYDVVVVLDHNFRHRVRGLGSAVFLHVAKPGYPPTEGCIALAPRDMARILPHLRRGRRIAVI